MKKNLDYYVIGGKKEALRARLLKTTSPEIELPDGLKDTYENTEDYMKKSFIDIYKPLMTLVDKIGATDIQKQMLINVVDGILADKKMIVPYDNPENQGCISYKTIEEKVGIKLNSEAITLLGSFTNTYLNSEVTREGQGHSIIISTHRIPQYALFYINDKGDRVDLSQEAADELAKQQHNVAMSYGGNVEAYFIGKQPEPIYERYVDGKLVRTEEATQEEIETYGALLGKHYLDQSIENPITDHEILKNTMVEFEQNDRDGIRRKIFRILLNNEIARKINPSELVGDEKLCFEKFMSQENGWGKEAIRWYLTPESLLDDEFILDKVPGLKESIDEIYENVNMGSISNLPIRKEIFSKSNQLVIGLIDRFEKILVQGIFDGQISDYDYFSSMKSVRCMEEFFGSVKLSKEELLKYILKSQGAKSSNIRDIYSNGEKGEEENYK